MEPRYAVIDDNVDESQQHQGDVETHSVHVVVDNPETEKAADFSGWATFLVTGDVNGMTPVQILPYNRKRKKAVIWCLPGFVTNNTTGYVNVGRREQVQAGAAKQSGGLMVSGMMITVESQPEHWIAGDGSHELTVVVFEERYA